MKLLNSITKLKLNNQIKITDKKLNKKKDRNSVLF